MHSSIIEAIRIKKDRIECRHPNDYRNHKLWKQLDAYEKQVTIKETKEQLEYHKERVKRMGEKDAYNSLQIIKNCECYLAKHDKGEMENDNN